MWCIPTVNEEFIDRMEHLLTLYAKPYDAKEPLLCFDEKSKQLLKDTRPVKHTRAGRVRQRDYEYERNGTKNIFMAVEPKGGWRAVTVTARRTKIDFAHRMKQLIELPRYAHASQIHIVLDNLNTHFASSLIEAFGTRKAKRILKRITFHYTPKHASWLNMAEIELSILSRQALAGRIPTENALKRRVARWQRRRNKKSAMIQWKFTKEDARRIFKYEKLGN